MREELLAELGETRGEPAQPVDLVGLERKVVPKEVVEARGEGRDPGGATWERIQSSTAVRSTVELLRAPLA